MDSNYISCESFKKRMVDLCLRSGLKDFPSKRRDQLVLLKSMAVSFEANKVYTEKEVNESIKRWLANISCFPGWDHNTLRRRLVDEKFLDRNPDGSCYRINPAGPAGIVFDSAVAALDVREVISEGERFIARRKSEYLQMNGDSR